jgi:hypothetical protein
MQFALVALGAAALASQLLLPGFTGIANNGDFSKVYGWLCLAPRGAETNFVYFQPDYVWSAGNYWNSPYHSSESALAWLATRLAGATHEAAIFDIRWLGALHAALFLSALVCLLAALRGMPPWSVAAIAALPVVIFTDVCYSAYLNSFYMDAASLCGLLLMAATGLWMAMDERAGLFPAGLFAAAAVLFVTSKAQHAVWMMLPAAWLIAYGVRAPARRAAAWSAVAAVLLAGVWMLRTTDPAYRGEAMFNLLFYRLGPQGADLAALGVLPDEMHYRGMHAYVPEAPTANRQWTEAFYRRTGFARLLAWYARHPRATMGFLEETLVTGVPKMRPEYLSNYRLEDGRPAGARTQRFALWSDLRSAALQHWPWHLAVWYGVFAAGCVLARSRPAWVALGIAALGAGELVAASLGDSLDAGRHLLLFHAATDLTLCFAAAWAIQRIKRQAP